jgi:uncharacterized C2H2 Zn-finger protein
MFKLGGLFKRKQKDRKGILKCKYCDMKFEDKERLKRHVRKAHSEKDKGSNMPNPNPFGGGGF